MRSDAFKTGKGSPMRSGAFKIRVVTNLRGLADRAEMVSPENFIDPVDAAGSRRLRAAQRRYLATASAEAASRALVRRIRTIADRGAALDETRRPSRGRSQGIGPGRCRP